MRDLSKIINMQNAGYESNWWRLFLDYEQKGLFFEESKIVNLSINVVFGNPSQFDVEWKNKKNIYSAENLNNIFVKENKKIDIDFFHDYKCNAVHISIEPKFILRE